jgi:hypothetical protein
MKIENWGRRGGASTGEARIVRLTAVVGAYPSSAVAVRCRGGVSTTAFEAVETLWWSTTVG